MALFSILISPLNAFPWVINGLMEAWVSTKRIQAFLELSELDLDQYYANMNDITAATTTNNNNNTVVASDDDQTSGNGRSPASDSQQNGDSEKHETDVEVHVSDDQGDNGLEPATRKGGDDPPVAKEGDGVAVGSRTLYEEANGSDRTYTAIEERSSSVRSSQRRNRIVVVRNGFFTWSRRDGERAGDTDSGEEKKGEAGKNSTPPSETETADSTQVASPVEWVLSDLNFTILSVNRIVC